MYVMNYTKPDIAYTISKLTRFRSNPSTNHLKANKKDNQVFEVHLGL
jgi:hypothetical protein